MGIFYHIKWLAGFLPSKATKFLVVEYVVRCYEHLRVHDNHSYVTKLSQVSAILLIAWSASIGFSPYSNITGIKIGRGSINIFRMLLFSQFPQATPPILSQNFHSELSLASFSLLTGGSLAPLSCCGKKWIIAQWSSMIHFASILDGFLWCHSGFRSLPGFCICQSKKRAYYGHCHKR